MANEHGEWIMHGVSSADPGCLHTVKELKNYIDAVGFLPLFKNDVPGFSVEEHTMPYYWWSDDPERDPWLWRAILAESGEVAYGKFFDKKAGFISREWLKYFANARRDGYDFDSRWEDGKASYRCKKLMDLFPNGEELYSFEMKQKAGFGKDGEKNFEGTVTELMMQTYLCIRSFRCRRNKHNEPYGWPIAVYTPPEKLFGEETVRGAYAEAPECSAERLREQMHRLYPEAETHAVEKMLK